MSPLQAMRLFPRFLLSMTLGLVVAVLTEVEVFLIFVLGVLLSLLLGPLAGSSVALALYIILRMVFQVAGLFARNRRGPVA